jgi:hypothetical protein
MSVLPDDSHPGHRVGRGGRWVVRSWHRAGPAAGRTDGPGIGLGTSPNSASAVTRDLRMAISARRASAWPRVPRRRRPELMITRSACQRCASGTSTTRTPSPSPSHVASAASCAAVHASATPSRSDARVTGMRHRSIACGSSRTVRRRRTRSLVGGVARNCDATAMEGVPTGWIRTGRDDAFTGRIARAARSPPLR